MRKEKEKMPRLLIVTPTFFPIVGGAEVGIHELANRLSQRYSVEILTPIPASKISLKDFYPQNYTVTRFKPFFHSQNKVLCAMMKPLSLLSVSYIFALQSYIARKRPDIINFHYAIPSGLALVFVRVMYGIPCILSIVGRVDIYNESTSICRKTYLKLVFNYASKIISINEYCVKGFSDKVVVIPYGVDIQKYKNAKPSSDLERKHTNKTIIFSLQRLEEVKRVDILIRAMQHIHKKRKDIVLLIGGTGSLKRQLEELTITMNLQKSIYFLGHVKDEEVPSLYKTAKIFVLHTTFETFGVVLAQAMAAGRAIVSTNVTAVPYVVKNKVNGYLVNPMDARRLGDAILHLVNNNSILKKIAASNSNKAGIEYDWNIISSKYHNVFTNEIRNLSSK